MQAVLALSTSVMGATIMFMAGKKRTRRAAWYLGVLNQALWATYAIRGGPDTLPFLLGCTVYGSVYVRNILRGD